MCLEARTSTQSSVFPTGDESRRGFRHTRHGSDASEEHTARQGAAQTVKRSATTGRRRCAGVRSLVCGLDVVKSAYKSCHIQF